jgi:divalent metal cation (Fe/Co/Zn/Cd) transporter
MGPGYESADDYGALVASALIIYNAFRMLKRGLSDVMDESPSDELKMKIIDIVEAIKGVNHVQDIKIRKSGLNYLVDLDIQVHGDLSVYESHDISEKVKEILKKSSLSVQDVMVHTEPYMEMGGIH